jgi:nitrite reductase/ring-hydroxylating ferredoxin subunit
MISKIRIFLLFIVLLIYLPGCDNTTEDQPTTSINIQISPTALSQIGIGTAAYCPVEGGIKGIIIYRESQEQYYAFERLCTNYPNDTCAITIDVSNVTATCPRCKSNFSLQNGSVLTGPATNPLTQYQATLNNSGRLDITN